MPLSINPHGAHLHVLNRPGADDDTDKAIGKRKCCGDPICRRTHTLRVGHTLNEGEVGVAEGHLTSSLHPDITTCVFNLNNKMAASRPAEDKCLFWSAYARCPNEKELGRGRDQEKNGEKKQDRTLIYANAVTQIWKGQLLLLAWEQRREARPPHVTWGALGTLQPQ